MEAQSYELKPISHKQFNGFIKGKVNQKESWSEMKEPTKTRRTLLTICKYLV